MIEEEEKIVFYLEELDNNFSHINRTLKEIEEKIDRIYQINSKVVTDYKPFINMFKLKKKETDENDLNCNSSIIMKSNSPKDPFTDERSQVYERSQIYERSQVYEKSLVNKDASSSSVTELKIYSDSYIDDCSSSEINEFDIDRIPEIFKGEEDFFKIYNFILESKKVKFEDIVDYDKICVYLEVLRNKKFIKKKGCKFFIE